MFNTFNKTRKQLKFISRCLFLFLLIVFTASCEDVIDIDLNDVEPRTVIAACITDQVGPYTVMISKTGDYFEPSVFPAVSNAVVQITDDAGNSEILQESETGIYQSDSLQGTSGRTYTLNVIAEGKEYEGTSIMPEALEIDSLGYEYEESSGFGPGEPGEEDGYILHCYFTDRVGIEDYCRFRVFCNNELVLGMFLYDDRFTDGNAIDFNDFKEKFQVDDTLRVELLTYNEITYDYFSSLQNALASGDQGSPMMSVTPANPNTNLSNDALGYFGAFTVRTETIIIQE